MTNNPVNTFDCFRLFLKETPPVTIKSFFKKYHYSFEYKKLKAFCKNKFSLDEQVLDQYLKPLIEAKWIFSAKNSRKISDDSIFSLSLKCTILVNGVESLKGDVETLDIYGNPKEVDEEDFMDLLKTQFSILLVENFNETNPLCAETYGQMINRLALLPEITLTTSSKHMNAQFDTGLCLNVKERLHKLKNITSTARGCDIVDWLMYNTTCVNRNQALALSEVLLQRAFLKSLNDNAGFNDNNNDIYRLPISGLRHMFGDMIQEEGTEPLNDSADPQSIEKNREIESSQAVRQNSVSHSFTKKQLLLIILDDKQSLAAFSKCLQKLLCTENLDFYLKVKDFTFSAVKSKGSPQIVSEAREIWNTFLENDELNVEDNEKRRVKQLLDSGNVDESIFDNMQKHVFFMMMTDSMAKFLTSEEFKTIQARLTFLTTVGRKK